MNSYLAKAAGLACTVLVAAAATPVSKLHSNPALPADMVQTSEDSDIYTVAIPKMTGKWRGSISIPGVHSQSVSVTVASQNSKGTYSGTLTTSADSSLRVTVSGKIKTNRYASITLSGGHTGGSINGTGVGKLSSNKKSITYSMTFVRGTQKFAGTLTLNKI